MSLSDGPAFEKGQFVNLKFTPLPNETALAFNAYVKSVLTTADGKAVCIGMEMVGLEASSEGRLDPPAPLQHRRAIFKEDR